VAQGKYFPTIKEALQIVFTFGLTILAWIFFRSETIGQALLYIAKIFSKTIFSLPSFKSDKLAIPLLFLIIFFMIIEWIGREKHYAIAQIFESKNKIYRLSFYYLIIIFIFLFAGSGQQFIYFQF
jgi:hypothetical protein